MDQDDDIRDLTHAAAAERRLRSLIDGYIERCYRLGELYQSFISLLPEPGPDAFDVLRDADPNLPLSDIEWAAAVTRHFALAQAERFGLARLAGWLWLSQYLRAPVDGRDPATAEIDAALFDGTRIKGPLTSVRPSMLRTLVRAAQRSLEEEGAPPDELLLPQDYVGEASDSARRDAKAILPEGLLASIGAYGRGGHIYVRMRLSCGKLRDGFPPENRGQPVSETKDQDHKPTPEPEPIEINRVRLDKMTEHIRELARSIAEDEYTQGVQYNHLLSSGALRRGRFVSGARFAESIDPRLDGPRVQAFGRVARYFSEAHLKEFGMSRLASLLAYLELNGEERIPEDPTDFVVALPNDQDEPVKKRFADCNATELEYAVIDLKKRHGIALSYDDEDAEELRTPEGRARWEEERSTPARKPSEGPDAKVIPLAPQKPET